MTTTRPPWAQALTDLRTAAGVTQKQAAEAINNQTGMRYTANYVASLEAGRRNHGPIITHLCTLYGAPERAAAICAQAGTIHPEIVKALDNPAFAERVWLLRRTEKP